jgi:hypothetical protein
LVVASPGHHNALVKKATTARRLPLKDRTDVEPGLMVDGR